MALSVPIDEPQRGLSLQTSYWRIETLTLQPKANPRRADITIIPYASKTHANTPGAMPLRESRSFGCVNRPAETLSDGSVRPASNDYDNYFGPQLLATKDPFAQAYAFVKQSPLFEGATDV